MVAPPLLRDWDFLQDKVIPPLLDIEPDRVPTVWSIGSAADGVAVAVAYHDAQPIRDAEINVYASEPEPDPGRISFALADLRCVPARSRDACFVHNDLRWIPESSIAERLILTEPSEPVDLVTVRATNAGVGVADQGFDQLRNGGFLVLLDGQAAPSASGHLLPVGRDGRIFRKRCRDRTGPIASEPALGRLVGDGPADTLARRQMQAQFVRDHIRLARSLARRFANHGEASEDLTQVALLALVKASRRFDPNREVAFATYATASIVGELKRHFRDKSWMLRVPRSMQETYLAVKDAREELAHQLHASPTVAQIAAYLEITEEAVLDAMEAGDNYWPSSLDAGPGEDDAGIDIPVIDSTFDQALDRHELQKLWPRLDSQEQVVLKRLYFDGWTQRRLASDIGVSPMHVSRLLVRTMGKLRVWLDEAS